MLRWLILLLIGLLVSLQYRLWMGEGSLSELQGLREQLGEAHEELDSLRRRNAALAAEVLDLKTGSEAIEDRARGELGMIKRGEIFLHVVEEPAVDGGGR